MDEVTRHVAIYLSLSSPGRVGRKWSREEIGAETLKGGLLERWREGGV